MKSIIKHTYLVYCWCFDNDDTVVFIGTLWLFSVYCRISLWETIGHRCEIVETTPSSHQRHGVVLLFTDVDRLFNVESCFDVWAPCSPCSHTLSNYTAERWGVEVIWSSARMGSQYNTIKQPVVRCHNVTCTTFFQPISPPSSPCNAPWFSSQTLALYILCSEKTPTHIFFHISMNDVWI